MCVREKVKRVMETVSSVCVRERENSVFMRVRERELESGHLYGFGGNNVGNWKNENFFNFCCLIKKISND